MSATAAQIAASQANAKLSTGPATAEGKQRSAANATTHGATSKKALMPWESLEEYQAFSESVFRDYRPANEHEKLLAKMVVDTTWRYKRIIAAEDLVMAAGPDPEQPGNEIPLAGENTAPVIQLFLRPSGQKSLNLMLRYLRDAERAMFKARAELERIQKLRYHTEIERAAAGACGAIDEPRPAVIQQTRESAPTEAPPALTRAERRAMERARRKADRKANRAGASLTAPQIGFVSSTQLHEQKAAA